MNIAQFYANNGNPMSAGVSKVLEKYSKLVALLPVKQIDDLTHRFGKEVSLGGVSRRVLNQAVSGVNGSVVTPMSEPVEILNRQIKTDHRLVDARGDARGQEAARGVRAIARQMEDDVVNGSRLSATTPNSIDGLKARCSGNQLISAGANGGQYSIDLLEQLKDSVVDQGSGKILIFPQSAYRKHNKLLRVSAGGSTVADMTTLFPTYEGVPIVVIGDKLDGTSILDFNETQGTDTATASIYCIAPGNDTVELSGVKILMASNGIQMIEEGIRDGMYIDVLEVCFGLAVYDDTAVARLAGVKIPT